MKSIFTLLLILSLCACGSSGGSSGGGSTTPPPPPVVTPVPLGPWVGGYTGSTLHVITSTGDSAGNWVGIYSNSGQFSSTNNNADVPLIQVQPDGEGWLGHGLFRVDGSFSEYWRLTLEEHADGLRLHIRLHRGLSSADPSTYVAHPSNTSQFTAILIMSAAG